MRFGVVIFAATVASVGAARGVLKKGHPGEIVFELELVEVHSVHRLDTNAYKLLGQFGDLGVLTDNLPVEIGASLSPFTAKDDKHRLAGLATSELAPLVVVDPADLSTHRIGCGFFFGLGREREQQDCDAEQRRQGTANDSGWDNLHLCSSA